MYWGSRFTPTDITNPATGEPLYVWAKVRPRWYWWIRRLMLFLGIVWREWEPGYRLDISSPTIDLMPNQRGSTTVGRGTL